jgi:hypothetical protein
VIVDSISNVVMSNVSRIIIVVMRATVEASCGSTADFERLFTVLGKEKYTKLDFLYAEHQTADAVETVALAITTKGIRGPIFIKDADNDFSHTIFGGNYVTFTSIVGGAEMNNTKERALRPDLVDAAKKSYLSFSYDNVISNVAYGSLLSSNFCCGGWGFLRASDFLSSAATLRGQLQTSGLTTELEKPSELKVMDVLWHMALEGHLFFGIKASDYKDWGSQAAWLAAIRS